MMEEVKIYQESRDPELHVMLRGYEFRRRTCRRKKHYRPQVDELIGWIGLRMTKPLRVKAVVMPSSEACLTHYTLNPKWTGLLHKFSIRIRSSSRRFIRKLLIFVKKHDDDVHDFASVNRNGG